MYINLIDKYLPYFWNNELNLLYNLNPEEIRKISNRLGKIIKKINISIEDDPYVIASYICKFNTSRFNWLSTTGLYCFLIENCQAAR